MHGGLWIPKTGSDIASATGTPAEASFPVSCEINGPRTLYDNYLYLNPLPNPSFSGSMDARKTKELEYSSIVPPFLEACIATDKKSAELIGNVQVADLKDEKLLRTLFKVTTFSSKARAMASYDQRIFGLRIKNNIVATNITRWELGNENMNRMIRWITPEDMVLVGSDGYSFAENIARKGDEDAAMSLLEKVDASTLKALRTHDGKSICKLLWDRGGIRVRLTLSSIGASFGKLDTFDDIELFEGDSKLTWIDLQKACNMCWNWIENSMLRKSEEEAERMGEKEAATLMRQVRKGMVKHRRDATPELIGNMLIEIDNLEMWSRKREKR